MVAFLQKFRSTRLLFLTLSVATALPIAGQVYPSFPASNAQSSIILDQGASAAQVPNGLYGTALMAVYASSTSFGYAIMPDGQNVAYSTIRPNQIPAVNCNAATPSTCSAAVAVFQGSIYSAYSDGSTHGLNVVIATPIPNGVGYAFSVVHQDASVALTTSPSMAVFNNKLIIMFGASNNPNVSNAFYQITFDGSNWSSASQQYLGTSGVASGSQPGMAVLGNKLFMTLQQNNSRHQLFVYSSTDGVTWPLAANVTNLGLGSGASLVNYNGSLVLATQQNNSNHQLFIFSSADGVNWGYQQYSNIALGATPGLALFNSGISLVFKQNNSNNVLFTDFATH